MRARSGIDRASLCPPRISRPGRLARQRALHDEEILGAQKTGVRGNHVTGRQLDDVAGDQFGDRQLPQFAVSKHGCGDRDHGFQLRGRAVGPPFLSEPKADAQHDHHGHHGAGASIARGKGNGGQHRQQQHQRIDDGAPEEQPDALSSIGSDDVVTVLSQSRLCLGSGQTGRATAQPLIHAFSRQRRRVEKDLGDADGRGLPPERCKNASVKSEGGTRPRPPNGAIWRANHRRLLSMRASA